MLAQIGEVSSSTQRVGKGDGLAQVSFGDEDLAQISFGDEDLAQTGSSSTISGVESPNYMGTRFNPYRFRR